MTVALQGRPFESMDGINGSIHKSILHLLIRSTNEPMHPIGRVNQSIICQQ